MRMKHIVAAFAMAIAGSAAASGDSLVKDGSFDLSVNAPSAEYADVRKGTFTLFTEDLSWNKCGKLTVQRSTNKRGGPCHHAKVEIGGENKDGFKVEAGAFYDVSLELKGDVPVVFIRAFQISENGKVRRRLPMELHVKPGKEWKRFAGRFAADASAERAQIEVELWSNTEFKDGDFVLIDNVRVTKSALNDKMFGAGRKVVVAPVDPMVEMGCPFLPESVMDPPSEISFRAAVNEQKPLAVAVANLTAATAQYRVVLETVPEPASSKSWWPDDGKPGLKGFPPAKITAREALRFKDTEQDPPTLRLDPLMKMNEIGVITVPPHEAGLVWYDFDTRGVRPGVYKGRIRVIPLGEMSEYKLDNKARRYVPVKTSDVIMPVTFTVDPIVLPLEAVRPAHFCCEAESQEAFNIMADIGCRCFQLNIWGFHPDRAADPNNSVAKSIRRHRAWAKERGIDIKFFVKYAALSYSQRAFNKENKPELKWKVFKDVMLLIKRMMNDAGVDDKDYIVNTCDEPFGVDLPDLIEAHRLSKEVVPTVQLYLSLCVRDIIDHDFLTPLNDNIDMWVFLDSPVFFDGKLYERIKAIHEAGKPMMHYMCSTMTTSSLSAYYRRHCWRGEHFNMEGDFMYTFMEGSNIGRGVFSLKTVTKGGICYKPGGVFVPSIRYMAYREGVTDIKYLATLRKLAGGDPEVEKFLRGAAKDVVIDNRTLRDLPAKKREQIREMILKKYVPAKSK